MKGPLGFNAEDLLQETLAMQRKLMDGLTLLPSVEDVEYGVTTREEVWRDGKVALYRFVGGQAPVRRTPLLIVYALVNRPYMVDLQTDRSLVQKLLALGHDVYVLDWGYPDRSERYQTLEDYLLRFVDGAVDHLQAHNGGEPINMLGICQGGVFALCYAALRQAKLANLITADLMNASYLMLKPFRLNVQKYVGLLDILDDKDALEDFLRMEKWIFDSPDLAGEAFRDFIKQFYQGNGLMHDGVRIGEEHVDLQQVTLPVLNIYAEQDHLVPPDASRALRGRIGSADYTESSFRGGHIGIYVSGRAQREVPATIDNWLKARDV